jgi:hypothetical protein
MLTPELSKMTPYELGETGRSEAIPYLDRYLQVGSSAEKRLAASAIRKLTPAYKDQCEHTVPYLINCLSDEAPQVRQYSLKALLPFQIPKHLIPEIQRIFHSDDKDYNRKVAEKILAKMKIKTTTDITAHYDDDGYYAYVLLDRRSGQIEKSDIETITTKLETIGVIRLLYGRSYRPASDGKQYQWYVRVSDQQGNKPNRQKVENLLNINQPDLTSLNRSEKENAYVKHLQQNLEQEQKDKENLKSKLQTAEQARQSSQQQLKTLLHEKLSLQIDLEKLRRASEENQSSIEASQAENTILEQLALEEKNSLQNQISALEEQIQQTNDKLSCTNDECDRLKIEKDDLQKEIYELQGKYDSLQQQPKKRSNAKQRLENDLTQFLKCLLPNLAIHKGSISFLTEIKDYSKILEKLSILNIDSSLVNAKNVEAVEGWLEISHVSTGDGDEGRIYYTKSRSADKRQVLISSKQSQKQDLDKLKKWKL